MNYSFTGISYLSAFLVMGYFIYRLYQYWEREKTIISKLWVYLAGSFGLFMMIKAIGGMFFANSEALLKMTIYVGSFFQAFGFAIMAYFIFVLKFPQISPWLGFIPIFILGLTEAILTIFVPFHPFLSANGVIDWGIPSGPLGFIVSTMRAFLFFITFLPFVIIHFLQLKNSQDYYAKMKSLGLGLALFFMAATAMVDVLFVVVFKLGAVWRDATLIFGSIILFLTLFLTRKSVPKQIKQNGERVQSKIN